jgi:CYTH domain-containing protein
MRRFFMLMSVWFYRVVIFVCALELGVVMTGNNTVRVRFRSFEAWLRVNSDFVEDMRKEFPLASPAQIERLLLRFYRNQLLSDRVKLMRFVSSCLPGESTGEIRKSSGKEVNQK